jgi:hypothetical protein
MFLSFVIGFSSLFVNGSIVTSLAFLVVGKFVETNISSSSCLLCNTFRVYEIVVLLCRDE